MLEYKQKRNNGRTPFAGVYKFVCVCVVYCIHAKLFPTVKRRTCIHVLRHYSRNSYFGRHAIFLGVQRVTLGRPGQKALQTMIEPTLLWVFADPFIQHLFFCPTSQDSE